MLLLMPMMLMHWSGAKLSLMLFGVDAWLRAVFQAHEHR